MFRNFGGGFFDTQDQEDESQINPNTDQILQQNNQNQQNQGQQQTQGFNQQQQQFKAHDQQNMTVPVTLKMLKDDTLGSQNVYPKNIILVGRIVSYKEEMPRIIIQITDDTIEQKDELISIEIQKPNALKPQYMQDFQYSQNMYVKMIVHCNYWQDKRLYICEYFEEIKDFNFISRHNLEIILRQCQRQKKFKLEEQKQEERRIQYSQQNPIIQSQDEFLFKNSVSSVDQNNSQQQNLFQPNLLQQYQQQNQNQNDKNEFQQPQNIQTQQQSLTIPQKIKQLIQEDLSDDQKIYKCFDIYKTVYNKNSLTAQDIEEVFQDLALSYIEQIIQSLVQEDQLYESGKRGEYSSV